MGPCWPHFPPKWNDAVEGPPLFCWVYVIFRFGSRPGVLLALFFGGWGRFFYLFVDWGSILIGFGVHFGGFWWPLGSYVLSLFDDVFYLVRFGSFWMSWWGHAKC